MLVDRVTGPSAGTWAEALKTLERAYAPGLADETYGILINDILHSRAVLWVAHLGVDIYGVAATKVVVYPNGRKVCVVTACAGYSFAKWRHALAEIEKYAKDMGCAAVRISGRKGWKILKAEGYREPWVMLEKEL